MEAEGGTEEGRETEGGRPKDGGRGRDGGREGDERRRETRDGGEWGLTIINTSREPVLRTD